MSTSADFKNTERILNYYFDIKGLIRMGDEYDDPGFIMSISTRKDKSDNKTYLHICNVGYEGDIESYVLFDGQNRKNKDEEFDFLTFDNDKEAIDYLRNEFIPLLDLVLLYDEDGYFEADLEFSEEIENFPKGMCMKKLIHIETVMFTFTENPDKCKNMMLGLLDGKYVPNFTD